MTEPALLVVDDEPDDLDQLQRTLGRRYGQEYLVICEDSAAAALDRLSQLAADGRPVAIVCAAAAMIDSGGGEFLALARRLHPAAKRVLTVPRGGSSAPSLRVPALLLQDPSVAQPVLRAMTLGVVDTCVTSWPARRMLPWIERAAIAGRMPKDAPSPTTSRLLDRKLIPGRARAST